MPNRHTGNSEYDFGFQNQENDDEIAGKGNRVNYKYRMHDTRIGRFFATDPLEKIYSYNSPYAFSENRVIDAVELEGLEQVDYKEKDEYKNCGFCDANTAVLISNSGVVLYNSIAATWNYLDQVANGRTNLAEDVVNTSKSAYKGLDDIANGRVDLIDETKKAITNPSTYENLLPYLLLRISPAVKVKYPFVQKARTTSLVGKSADIDGFSKLYSVQKNISSPGGFSRLSNNDAWNGLIKKHSNISDNTKRWKAVNNEWWDKYNKPWLDEIIQRGDNIKITSSTKKGLFNKDGTATHWKREIDYLTEKGYKEVDGYFVKQ